MSYAMMKSFLCKKMDAISAVHSVSGIVCERKIIIRAPEMGVSIEMNLTLEELSELCRSFSVGAAKGQ